MNRSSPTTAALPIWSWHDLLRTDGEHELEVGDLALLHGKGALRVTYPGSAVVVAAWVDALGLAGMFRAPFPVATSHRTLAETRPLLFADRATESLLKALNQAGAEMSDIRVDLFGGGVLLGDHPRLEVGGRSLRIVESLLLTRGVRVRSRHTGTSWPSGVRLTALGQVQVRQDGAR